MPRTIANISAAVVAAVVFGAGLWFAIGAVVKHHDSSLFADPTEHRTVTTSVRQSAGPGARPKVTTTVVQSPATGTTPAQTTTTVVTETPAVGHETTTTKEADDSLFERALAGAGFLFFRVALAALAAFLAGAVVQRTLLGDFAIKVGPLEVPDLPAAAEASKSAITKVKESLKRQTTLLGRRLTQVATKLESNTATTLQMSQLLQEIATAVTDLERRVTQLEQKPPN
jgi:hypothetical protein